jgi:hypothetical protein
MPILLVRLISTGDGVRNGEVCHSSAAALRVGSVLAKDGPDIVLGAAVTAIMLKAADALTGLNFSVWHKSEIGATALKSLQFLRRENAGAFNRVASRKNC